MACCFGGKSVILIRIRSENPKILKTEERIANYPDQVQIIGRGSFAGPKSETELLYRKTV